MNDVWDNPLDHLTPYKHDGKAEATTQIIVALRDTDLLERHGHVVVDGQFLVIAVDDLPGLIKEAKEAAATIPIKEAHV